jgi:thiamine transport system ATP-binding protein
LTKEDEDILYLKNVCFTQEKFSLTADFSVSKRGRVAIIGPSGEGKSTLLLGISGFLQPTAGEVLWDGKPMSDHPGQRPLSILFQEHNLFPHLSAADNVALGLNPNMWLSKEQVLLVDKALDQVGLSEKAEAYPRDLSGGQRGRVGLARILLRKRPLILLDEPFSALGPALKDEMLEVLDKILKLTGATALMVTHDTNDAIKFADEAILVADGHAHKPQEIKSLFSNPPLALQKYIGTRR